MLNRLCHLLLTKLLWLLIAAVLAGAVVLALRTHDGHWLNRGGALIAALAAGSVLLQIVVEIGIERRRHDIESHAHSGGDAREALLPVEVLAERLRRSQSKFEIERLERQRLMIASRVVVCAMFGELLHGFGDVAACNTFVVCEAHVASAHEPAPLAQAGPAGPLDTTHAAHAAEVPSTQASGALASAR